MTSPIPARGKRTRKTGPRTGLPVIILTLFMWAALVCGGFLLAKNYIDRSFKEIQETNAMNVKALEERLNTLHRDIQEIESALAETDKTLSSANTTRQELNKKIEQLDNQLKELQKSLYILRESGDVEN